MSSHYEAMRAHVTEGVAISIPRGLMLFMRSGLAAWLQHCSSLPSTPHATASRLDKAPEAIVGSQQLASLLADMAMRPARWRHAV